MIDKTECRLEFNGEQFRVMAYERDLVTKIIRPRQVGCSSQDLHLVMRSAYKDLGDRMLVLELKVVPA